MLFRSVPFSLCPRLSPWVCVVSRHLYIRTPLVLLTPGSLPSLALSPSPSRSRNLIRSPSRPGSLEGSPNRGRRAAQTRKSQVIISNQLAWMNTWDDGRSAASSSPRGDPSFSSGRTAPAARPALAARAMAATAPGIRQTKAGQCTATGKQLQQQPRKQHQPPGGHNLSGNLHREAAIQQGPVAKPTTGRERRRLPVPGVTCWRASRTG